VTAKPIRIVLVDDHLLVREGVRAILEREDDLGVVGEAGDSATAESVSAREQPDVVLLDVQIPGAGVIATVQAVQNAAPAAKVIILSMFDGPQLVQSLLGLGVKGYLLKTVTRLELVAAIRSACGAGDRIVLSVSPDCFEPDAAEAGLLSPRERTVLLLVARAMSNGQIAARLSLTEATVKRHLRSVFAKLGAVSRIDAVNKAVAAALIPPPHATSQAGRGRNRRGAARPALRRGYGISPPPAR
jgi:DNA-binding NarL/FixJ family response regulator